MTTGTETVERLLREALMKTSHPEAHLLTVAEAVLAPRSDEAMPKGASRKMGKTEAFAAAAAVTRMMQMHGLTPSDICREAKVANQATGYYPFYLTPAEVDGSGTLLASLPRSRRIHRGLAPYVRMVRAIAVRSGASEADLLQELGLAVASYLAPFVAADRSPWDLIAEDVALLGPYFGKVRKGTDGDPVDMRRYFSDAERMNVLFDPATARMEPRPDRSHHDNGFSSSACVPLHARLVVSGQVRCWTYDEGMDGDRFSVPLGWMQASVFEVFFLGIVPDKRGLRTVLFAEPWTATFGDMGPGRSRPWGDGGLTDLMRGTPLTYGLGLVRDGEPHGLCFDDLPRFHCPDYERHVRDGLAGIEHYQANEWDPSPCHDALQAARRIDLDADTLRRFLGHKADDSWQRQLAAFADTPSHLRSFALPGAIALSDGGSSDALADRFREGLLGDGQEIVTALMDAVTKRVRAMDAYLAERTEGERFRRDRYRRLMRS
ncbi:hypothetical protein MHIMP23_00745 [Methylobacterium hispanicum]